MISIRQIDIGKGSKRPHGHFDVVRFGMAFLDEPVCSARLYVDKIMPPTANSVDQSSGKVWRSNLYWKSMSTSVRVFWRHQPSMALLGEPQPAVLDRTWASLKVTG